MGLLGFIDSGVTPPSSPVEPPPGIEPSYHDYKSCASPAMLKRLLWKTEDGGVDICFYDWRFSLLLAPLNPNQPIFYFLLRCLKELPASVFVVLLVFLLLNALLATLPTLLDVLGAFAILISLLFKQR